MKLSQFQFELPKARLAQRPAADRDESRLMILHRKEEKLEHHAFKDIINFFEGGGQDGFHSLISPRSSREICCFAKRSHRNPL